MEFFLAMVDDLLVARILHIFVYIFIFSPDIHIGQLSIQYVIVRVDVLVYLSDRFRLILVRTVLFLQQLF